MASQTTLDEKFSELLKAKQTHQNSRPKIQKVAEYLRNRKNFDKQYSPKLVSIGPIHHGNPNLKLGENYKLTWAAKYIENTQQSPQLVYKKITDNINELKGLFADDVLALAYNAESLKGFHSLEEKLSWLLFVDGCSLLYILKNVNLDQLDKPKDVYIKVDQLDKPNDMNIKVDQLDKPNYVNIKVDQLDEQEHDLNIKVDQLDEQEHLNIKVDQLVLVMMDVILLENQLPYLVLKLLWKNDNQTELIKTMKNFLKCHHWDTPDTKRTWNWQRILENNSGQKEIINIFSNIVHNNKNTKQEHEVEFPDEPPTHLLDLQRNIILTKSNPNIKANNEAKKKESGKSSEEKSKMMTYKNIQDLRAVGIKLKSSETRRPRDVDFSEGWFAAELTLPEIVVDDTTTATFLNLIAYEMCPDFENDYGICSFAVFMDSLIDHPEDVKELRSKGILLNSLGSDEEVANLFNIISTDLVLNPETYFEVKAKIHEHYCNKWKTWIAQGYHTYFSNPWAITGFLAAFIALALTFVQTWFSIYPR